MELWLLFILIGLGLFTYLLLKRSVANITRTPIWLLWLVMMTPPLIWSAWSLVYGQKPPPAALVFGPFLICPFLYWTLIQLGRPKPSAKGNQEAESTTQNLDRDPLAIASIPEEKPSIAPIDRAEETNLRNCFPWSIFYLEKLEYRPQAVLCLGKLRSNPEVAYKTIRDNIEGQFGDRFFVVFQESFSGKPFFALVPNPYAQKANQSQLEPITRPGLALALLAISLFTATLGGVEMAGFSAANWQKNPALLISGLSYSLSVIIILGVYELSQYIIARSYKVKITLPYFIPLPIFPFWKWNLGTLGALIQKRSPLPNRKALFDISIAGPIASLIVMFPFLLWGLANSNVVNLSEQSGIFNFDALNPRYSLLLTLLSKLALGSKLTAEKAIDLNLVAIAAYIGFIWTTFKLMPVGQLDGGQIVRAMFGQKAAIIISQICCLLMLLRSLIHPELFIWGIILFFIPLADQPALNDVSELDNKRDFLGLVVLAILVSIILPAPEILTRLLHI